MKSFFKANQRRTNIPGSGDFIYVATAPGQITIRVETRKGLIEYELGERDQVLLPKGLAFSEYSVINTSGIDGDIDIITGYGQFVPSGDNMRVVIKNADGTPLDVSAVFDGAQPVYQNLGSVFVVKEEGKSLAALPTITIDGSAQSIPENSSRKSIMLQAGESNVEAIVIAGFYKLQPGEAKEIEAINELTVTGHNNDTLRVGEFS
ncbi:hypothetical protein P7F88_19330 [Vibrio hannami]|uniref:hypothetical protein n=1 Tax=Vibrio hannami TaxID=2717094 RepID=UPI00240F5B67|nr:hypothetical protein [Vibrio hannami]MDG3088109.1 hypothetical protein [Vibrio hannami]